MCVGGGTAAGNCGQTKTERLIVNNTTTVSVKLIIIIVMLIEIGGPTPRERLKVNGFKDSRHTG